MTTYKPLSERFESKYIPEPNSGCWLWLGGVSFTTHGGPYGAIKNEHGLKPVMTAAHRVAYRLYKGLIPDKFDIDHVCENTLCVNPDHLQIMTHQNHIQLTYDRIKKGKCKRGHDMIPENTWISKKTGDKHCRPCFAARARERKTKNMFICVEED